MQNKRKSNIKIILLLMTLSLMVVLITACKSNDVPKEILNKYDKADNYNYFKMEEGIRTKAYYYTFMENRLLASMHKIKGNNSLRNNLNIAYEDYFFVDYKTGEKTVLDMDSLMGEEDFEKRITYDMENKQYLIYESYGDYIDVYDENWKYLKKIQLDFIDTDNSTFEIKGVCNGYIYLRVYINVDSELNFNLSIIDYNGKCIFSQDYLDACRINNMLLCKAEINKSEDNSDNKTKFSIEKIGDNNSLTTLEGYEICNDEDYHGFYPGDDKYDFYGLYTNEEDVYLVGTNSEKSELIFNFKDYDYPGLDSNNSNYSVTDIYSTGNGEYIIIVCDLTYNYKILYFSPSDNMTEEKEEVEKEEVVVLCENIDDSFERVVQSYNNQSTEYEIVIKDFEEDNKEEKMLLNVIGNGEIDGLILNDFGNEAYTHAGILQDLNEYFDKSNKVKKEDFLDNVLKSVTNEDGSIYQLFPEFQISGYMAKNDAKITDYFDFFSDNEAKMSVIANNYYQEIICNSTDTFVDTENKIIHSDKIQNLLETVKEQQKNIR